MSDSDDYEDEPEDEEEEEEEEAVMQDAVDFEDYEIADKCKLSVSPMLCHYSKSSASISSFVYSDRRARRGEEGQGEERHRPQEDRQEAADRRGGALRSQSGSHGCVSQ